MARKKILPKKLGPVKIPKALRRIGDKALADPQVVKILSGALVSVGAAVAARKVIKDVPGGAALARTLANSNALGSVTDVIKQALDEVLQTRHQAQEDAPQPARGKRPTAERRADA